MGKRLIATTAVLFLGSLFTGDLLPEGLSLSSLIGAPDTAVASGDGPTRVDACEQATQSALAKAGAHLKAITRQTCDCRQRASSIESWNCLAVVDWGKK